MKHLRYISLFLMLALLCAAASVAAVAAGTPTLTVANVEAPAGSEAAVTITMKDNPGVVNMQLTVAYDSRLTLVKVEDGKILGDSVHTANYKLNPYQLTWQNDTAPADFTDNGTLVTLTFQVANDATGTLPVTVTYDNTRSEIMNFDMETVDFTVQNGGVTVKAAEHTHTWDAGKVTKAATCKEEGVKTFTCTDCKETRTEKIPKDANNHNGYGTELKNAKPATTKAEGYTGDKVCKGCGNVLEKGKAIPKIEEEHRHTLVKTEAKAPTCTTEGTAAYYTCSGCGKMFSDADGKNEITKASQLPANGHSFGEWTVTKPATATEEGEETRTCSVCGATESRAIPKTGEDTPTEAVKGFNLKKVSLENNILRVAVFLKDCKGLESGGLRIQYDASVLRALPFDEDKDYGADALELERTDEYNRVSISVNTDYWEDQVDLGMYFKTSCDTDSVFELAFLTFEVVNPKAASTEMTINANFNIQGEKSEENHSFAIELDGEGIPDPTPTYTPGDVNNDGKIGSDDARLALRTSVKLEKDITDGTAAYKAADYNNDGVVKSEDARAILRVSVKLDPFG